MKTLFLKNVHGTLEEHNSCKNELGAGAPDPSAMQSLFLAYFPLKLVACLVLVRAHSESTTPIGPFGVKTVCASPARGLATALPLTELVFAALPPYSLRLGLDCK